MVEMVVSAFITLKSQHFPFWSSFVINDSGDENKIFGVRRTRNTHDGVASEEQSNQNGVDRRSPASSGHRIF